MVKRQKWYYIPNMISAYFPINRRLGRERERERKEREQEKERELICDSLSGYYIL